MQKDTTNIKEILLNILKYKELYNEYHEFLDIYGYYKKIWYRDYFKNIIGTERGIRDKNNKLRLFLYYDNNEELINTLVEKSNVKLETVNHPQE